MSKRKPIRTDIAWSTPSTITVKGFDLCKDILGTLSLGRTPSSPQAPPNAPIS